MGKMVVDAHSRKQVFAWNLDQLLRLLGLSRKDAAEQTGLSYKLVRRLVSQGISREDDRNRENLIRLVEFFALPSIGDLWRPRLIDWLLTDDEGRPFVKRFQENLLTTYGKESENRRRLPDESFLRLERATGHVRMGAKPIQIDLLEKVRAILASGDPRVTHFSEVIEVYYQRAIERRAETA